MAATVLEASTLSDLSVLIEAYIASGSYTTVSIIEQQTSRGMFIALVTKDA